MSSIFPAPPALLTKRSYAQGKPYFRTVSEGAADNLWETLSWAATNGPSGAVSIADGTAAFGLNSLPNPQPTYIYNTYYAPHALAEVAIGAADYGFCLRMNTLVGSPVTNATGVSGGTFFGVGFFGNNGKYGEAVGGHVTFDPGKTTGKYNSSASSRFFPSDYYSAHNNTGSANFDPGLAVLMIRNGLCFDAFQAGQELTNPIHVNYALFACFYNPPKLGALLCAESQSIPSQPQSATSELLVALTASVMEQATFNGTMTNLLQNYSFEDGAAHWVLTTATIEPYANYTGSYGHAALAVSEGMFGNSALRALGGYARQDVDVSPYADRIDLGTVYANLIVYAASTSTSSSTTALILRFYFLDAVGVEIGTYANAYTYSSYFKSGGHAAVYPSYAGNIPAGTRTVRVHIQAGTRYYLLIDNAAFWLTWPT